MRFENPLFLLLLLILVLLILWEVLLRKHGERSLQYSSRKLLGKTASSLKTRLITLLPFLKLTALTFLVLAASRPQMVSHHETLKKKGIDILIALDISGSMASIDYKPRNRLELAKQVISDFVKKRQSDRLGLVVFAGTAVTQCPLTIDYGMLKYYLSRTQIGEIEDGTAIGMALASAVNRIRVSASKTKIIILLTDGVNNRGEIAPLDAAKIALDYQIKVYTIGVGRKGKANFPVTDRYGNRKLVPVEVRIDEELLKNIAEQTGGIYFRAADQGSLGRIFAEIDKWEKTEIEKQRLSTRKDLYPYLLAAGLLLLLLVEFARRSVLRVLP